MYDSRPITKETIAELIQASLPDATVEVVGDDGRHFSATVISSSFAGKGLVAQHQMVYAALGPLMGETIHALALTTRAA